ALLAVAVLCLIYYNHYHGKSTHEHIGPIDMDAVDWSRFAYSQYATNGAYLCNSLMVFEALHRFGSRADRILFYPDEFDLDVYDGNDRDSQLLLVARDTYNVKIIPVPMQSVQRSTKEEEETWDFSLNKFLAFNQTQYDRILHIDSDVTVLQHMDDLFFLPSAPVAMPRAYWELPNTHKLTSLLVLLEPSTTEFEGLMHAAYTADTRSTRYDMEILNERYGDSAMVIPHRGFALLTGEFRTDDHTMYLGNDYEIWDADKVLEETRLVHYSDWPLPKPWIMWPLNLLSETLPKCKSKPGTAMESGCRDREVWYGLYDKFRQRRKEICALLSIPAPDWPPRQKPK
ncbi:glycosyltransferase family 8 protein, partial [Saccharata proteae CBS 121410]